MPFTTPNFQLAWYSPTTASDLNLTFDLARAVTNNFTTIDANAVPRFTTSAVTMTGSYSTSGFIRAANFSTTGTVRANQFISTVATGTAPLTVNSTTLVSNLNAETVGGLTSAQLKSGIITLFTADSNISTTSTTHQYVYSSLFTPDSELISGRTIYFEAILRQSSSNTSISAQSILYDLTAASTIATVLNTSNVEDSTMIIRSSAISLTAGNKYVVRYRISSTPATAYLYGARLILL